MTDAPPRPGRFRRNPKVYNLKFADSDLAGLEVQIRSLPISEFLKVTDLASRSGNDPESAKTSQEILRVLAGQIVEWNLDNEFGDPVNPDYNGLIKQELDFVMRIFTAWMDAMGKVPDPLEPSSASTGTSPVPLPQMAVSSDPPQS